MSLKLVHQPKLVNDTAAAEGLLQGSKLFAGNNTWLARHGRKSMSLTHPGGTFALMTTSRAYRRFNEGERASHEESLHLSLDHDAASTVLKTLWWSTCPPTFRLTIHLSKCPQPAAAARARTCRRRSPRRSCRSRIVVRSFDAGSVPGVPLEEGTVRLVSPPPPTPSRRGWTMR